MDHTTDYYSLLGIKRSANPTEIKQAYRKMVFRYHPDRNPEDDQAAEMFKQVLEAYETLSDGERRAAYDEANQPAEEPRQEDQDRKEQFGNHASNGFRFTHEFKNKVEPEPKCPQCSVTGVDQIVSRKGGGGSGRGKQFIVSPFNVIFCNQCGHVYGVTGASS